MSDTSSAAALRLTCQPSKSGNMLIFPYRLDNGGLGDVYAVQAVTNFDAGAENTAAVIMEAETGDVIIGRFMPPLPIDRRIAVPLIPLVRQVPAGGFLEGRIEVSLPLAETSPYFPDLTLRRYEIVDIKGVIVRVGYWPVDTGDLVARPYAEGSNLLRIVTADPLGTGRSVSQRFPTSGLQLFRRTDAFPRALE
ncbi:MAG: hypothetical protein AB7H90_05960 [Alphaproteobacteria bacterium]